MRDFNGQIGGRLTDEYDILGQYSTSKRNDNGQRFVNLVQAYNLKVLDCFFISLVLSIYSWVSPDGKVKNVIDFILSNKPKFFKAINQFNFKKQKDRLPRFFSLVMRDFNNDKINLIKKNIASNTH